MHISPSEKRKCSQLPPPIDTLTTSVSALALENMSLFLHIASIFYSVKKTKLVNIIEWVVIGQALLQ